MEQNYFILNLIRKVGIYKTCQIIGKISPSSQKTILQSFVDLLLDQKIIVYEELLEFIQEEKFKEKKSPKMKRQISRFSSIKNRTQDSESDVYRNEARGLNTSQGISVYTDNMFDVSSEIHDRFSLKSPKNMGYALKKTFL